MQNICFVITFMLLVQRVSSLDVLCFFVGLFFFLAQRTKNTHDCTSSSNRLGPGGESSYTRHSLEELITDLLLERETSQRLF